MTDMGDEQRQALQLELKVLTMMAKTERTELATKIFGAIGMVFLLVIAFRAKDFGLGLFAFYAVAVLGFLLPGASRRGFRTGWIMGSSTAVGEIVRSGDPALVSHVVTNPPTEKALRLEREARIAEIRKVLEATEK